MLNATAENYGGAVARRFFFGMFEGFFGPFITIYLTSFYTRSELGKRLAVYYSSSASVVPAPGFWRTGGWDNDRLSDCADYTTLPACFRSKVHCKHGGYSSCVRRTLPED